jgi:hypothetical protein
MSMNKEIHKIVKNKINYNYFTSNNYDKGVIMGDILNIISTKLHCYLSAIHYNNDVVLFDYYVEDSVGKYNYTSKHSYRYNPKDVFRKNKIEKIKSLI